MNTIDCWAPIVVKKENVKMISLSKLMALIVICCISSLRNMAKLPSQTQILQSFNSCSKPIRDYNALSSLY